MGRWTVAALVVALMLMALPGVPSPPACPPEAPEASVEAPEAPALPSRLASSPSFTENRGQFGDWDAAFYALGGQWSVAVGGGWVAYDVHGQGLGPAGGGTVVRVTFVGGRTTAPAGSAATGSVSHFLRGSDPERWVTDVPDVRSVALEGLWDGIDLGLRFEGGELKYEFTVAPGRDPSAIVMAYEGMTSLEVDGASGDLLVGTPSHVLRDRAPVTYQPTAGGGRAPIPSQFRLLEGRRVSFQLGSYDPSLPLTIDPGMMFSTFLGAGGYEAGNDVAVDADGRVYVAGSTDSSTFPLTPGAYDSSVAGRDAFVSRFSPDGSALDYSTFLGGSSLDEATGVAVGDDGLVHLAGTTTSPDFPVTDGAFCTTTPNAWGDAFALALNVTGSSLLYSTYVGGGSNDFATAIDLDADGSAYVAGGTQSTDFPAVPGSFRSPGEGSKAFVAKLAADGSDLEYCCLLGEDFDSRANGLAVDDAGCAYVTGQTSDKAFPTTEGCYQSDLRSTKYRNPRSDELLPDAFVTKLNAGGTGLVYSTYVGETDTEVGLGIDVGADGCAYVVGHTNSTLFPLVPKGTRPQARGLPDSFVLKLDAAGGALEYSLALELTNEDMATSVAVDAEGRACAVGYLEDDEGLPVGPNAFQSQGHWGSEEVYVLMVNPEGDGVAYASYLGGEGDDRGAAIAVDGDGLVYVTGWTLSANGFPSTAGAFDETPNPSGSGDPTTDAFLCKLDISAPGLVNDTSGAPATTGDPYTFNLTVRDNLRVEEVALQYRFGDGANATVLPLALSGGEGRNGSWTATIAVANDSLAPLFYRAWALDHAGLNTTLTDWSVPVVDNDLPVLEGLAPSQGGTGDELGLWVRATDNIRVDAVGLLLLPLEPPGVADEPWVREGPVVGADNTTYGFTVVLPRFFNGTVRYRFWANDTSGNWRLTDVLELEVVDDDAPLITVDAFPEMATTGEDVLLRVTVRDNIDVARVEAVWWYDRMPDPVRTTLPMGAELVDASGCGHYNCTLSVPFTNPIPFDMALPIRVRFVARDTAGNKVTTETWFLPVRDNDPPWFLDDLSPDAATTGDPFSFVTRPWDNIALDQVIVNFWYDGGPVNQLSLGRGVDDTFCGTTIVPHAWTALHYFFLAMDTDSNINRSRQWDVRVSDNDAPIVRMDNTSEVATTGGALTFDVMVEDNLYLESVTVVYWADEWPRREVGLRAFGYDAKMNGFYRARVEVPVNTSGYLRYTVVATDHVGNVGTRGGRDVRVLDDDPPWFGNDLSDGRAWRGMPFRMDIEVLDNVALAGLSCEWWYGDGVPENVTVPLDDALTIIVPRDPTGPLRFVFLAVDGAGNWARSREHLREVLNAVPRLSDGAVWNVTEGVDETLDLRDIIDDPDDHAWVISVGSQYASLEGYELRARYDVWVPDHVVELSISDGRDTGLCALTVHVVPVNDPPSVTGMLFNWAPFDATNGTAAFRRDQPDVLSVQAWDEEGDPISYAWLMGGEVVATGQELRRGDLPGGTYKLTLQVGDGTDVTDLMVTVSVPDVAGPGRSQDWATVALVVALVLLTVSAVMAFRIARGRGRDRA